MSYILAIWLAPDRIEIHALYVPKKFSFFKL